MTTVDTGLWFPNVLVENDIAWGAVNPLKACAVLDSWTPDWDAQLGYGDIGTDEHAVTGNYVAGGFDLANIVKSTTGGRFTLTADDIAWTLITLTAVKHIVVYDPDGTSPVTDPIVAGYTYTNLLSNSGGTFTVPWQDSPVANCVAALRNPGVS